MVAKSEFSESPRTRIMRIEEKLFAENKAVINEATVVSDPKFKKYWRNYKRAIHDYKKIATVDEVLLAAEKARVVLIGDYHTLDQSQRSFVRLMRSGFERNKDRKVVVALEAVQARFQKLLDDFTVGRIHAAAFIKKIGFKQHWFFDLWKNYEVVFDFLIYHHIPLLALDADNRQNLTLLKRDAFMAERIVEYALKYPDEKVFVLVGDLHLAPQHLPKAIRECARQFKTALPLLTLYQNSADIYWRLSKKGIVDHVDMVKISDTEFCRMHTPPLIVQQSYLNWLYHEDDTFDWIDAKSSFLRLAEQIAKITGLALPPDYEDVEVYTCGDLSFLKTLRQKKIFTKTELNSIQRQVLSSQSYFLPRARVAYIANVSVHHAAEEATHYLKLLYSGEEFPRARRDAFYAGVLHEALGFFGSKLINPKRKCQRTQDFVKDLVYLKQFAMTSEQKLQSETAHVFIAHAKGVRAGRLIHAGRITGMSSDLFLAATHAIGYDLGDQLYYGFMAGRVPAETIRLLFMERFEDEGETGEMYLSLVRGLKGLKRPAKI